MNLLSLASRQIWPHVLLVAHLKPQRLFLLHSENAAESRTPVQRVKQFFDQSNLVAKGNTALVWVSDSDFSTIETQLDELQTNRQLLLSDCVVNFTGGNKLMATAAFRWAAKRGVRALYLERRNQLTWFEPCDGDVLTRNECVDGHLTDTLDSLPLLRCQLDASDVDREGQRIELNRAGRTVGDADFWRQLPLVDRRADFSLAHNHRRRQSRAKPRRRAGIDRCRRVAPARRAAGATFPPA